MASIRRRVGKNGNVTWQVRWREGGGRGGVSDEETCDHEGVALDFAALVRLAGERRPEGYPKGCRGMRLLQPLQQDLTESDGKGGSESPAVTVEDAFNEYVATLVDAEPRTVAEYRRAFGTHVRPAVVELPDGSKAGPLGSLPVAEAANVDIWQGWVSYMRAKTHGEKAKRHYAPKTILNIHGAVISPTFEFAVFRRHCTLNPCRWVRLPERKGRPIKAHHVLDVDEFAPWIDCAYAVDTDTGDVTALVLGTGIRWGELTALRPCDVKVKWGKKGRVKGGVLTIAQVVKEDENRQPYIASTEGKSENAFRKIAIGVEAAAILLRRMEGKEDDALLFPAPGNRGGWIWRNSNFHSHRWMAHRRRRRPPHTSHPACPTSAPAAEVTRQRLQEAMMSFGDFAVKEEDLRRLLQTGRIRPAAQEPSFAGWDPLEVGAEEDICALLTAAQQHRPRPADRATDLKTRRGAYPQRGKPPWESSGAR